MNNARHFGHLRSERHVALEREFPGDRPSWLEASRNAARRCNQNCNQGRACDCVPNVEESPMPTKRSTRATWRDMHCAHRASYACAVEGPRPGRIRNWLSWATGLGLVGLALTAPQWWPK